MYQLQPQIPPSNTSVGVVALEASIFIPFDPANTDYQAFKKDLSEGASLNDADGNPMTAEQIASFLATLP